MTKDNSERGRRQNRKWGSRRRLLQFSLGALFFAGVSTSCSSDRPSVSASPTEDSRYQVALVMPRSRSDDSWSKSGYEGLQLIEKQLGVQVAYTDEVDKLPPGEIEQVFRQYAQEGFNFIIGQGGQFEEAIAAVAEEFPRTNFAIVGGYEGNGRNFGALGFRMTDLGYLFGAIATLKSKSQKVGIIGGLPLPDYVAMTESFEQGAKAIDPEVEVAIEWIDSFDNPEKARQLTEKMIAQGIDAIAAYGGQGIPAILDVAAAENADVLPIDEEDRESLAPETVLTTGILKIPLLLLEGARLAQKGNWEGKQYRFGLEKEVIEIGSFQGALTAQTQDRVEVLKQQIVEGKIDVSP